MSVRRILVCCVCGSLFLSQVSALDAGEKTGFSRLKLPKILGRRTPSGQSTGKTAEPSKERDWITGIPQVTRSAKLISSTIPTETFAALIPSVKLIGKVSTNGAPDTVSIVRIGDHEIRSLDDAYVAAHMAAANGSEAVIRTRFQNQDADTTVSTDQLLQLCQVIEPSQVIRIGDSGGMSVLLRDQSMQCLMKVRAERSTGLIQLKLDFADVLHTGKQLPVDVQVVCNNAHLACLKCPEILDALYGDHAWPAPLAIPPGKRSFATVCDAPDYRMPTNFHVLDAKLKQKQGLSLRGAKQPAFAALPDRAYPGSPLLGDARILSAVLLDRQLQLADEQQRNAGWLVFGGGSVQGGGDVIIQIDLGSGYIAVPVSIPRTAT